MRFMSRYFLSLTALSAVWFIAGSASGQPAFPGNKSSGELPGLLGSSNSGFGQDQPVTIDAEYILRAGQPGELIITATIAPAHHIYALDQPKGGPLPAKIVVDESPDFTVGEFSADPKPREHVDENAFKGVTVREHEGSVRWTAPLNITEGANLGALKVSGKISWQVCEGEKNCRPGSAKFTARLSAGKAPVAQEPSDVGRFKLDDSHANISGYVAGKSATAGGKVRLVLQVEPIEGYHVYELLAADPKQGNKPTLIGLRDATELRPGPAYPSAEPKTPTAEIAASGGRPYYDGLVSWTIDFDVPADYSGDSIGLVGAIGYQVCLDESCERPRAVNFEVNVPVTKTVDASGTLAVTFAKGKAYDELAKLIRVVPGGPAVSTPADDADGSLGLGAILALALLGGFILNFMPCVLPVVGLKVLSFVQQSGHSRLRVLSLNAAYAAGVVSIFLVLAAFTTGLLGPLSEWLFGQKALAWGQHFTSLGFVITMTSIVFAMALSFLGVWEIPLPGFVGGKGANDLAAKEGLTGAFIKGMLTTILATPCSGPFIGQVLGFTLGKPSDVVFSIYGCAGLGMALPYLLIGAFPVLVKFLPKPGPWMDTFKHAMGFLSLAAVLWLFNSITGDYRVVTLGLLFGLWAGFWWIGRTPGWKELPEKLKAWAIGGAIAAVTGWAVFFVFAPREEIIPWKPFNRASIDQLRKDGKSVMVDFTAEWCATCKLNIRLVLETDDVANALSANRVVSMKADWTEPSDEIETTLAELNSKSIPVFAIYPADPTRPPIVLRDLLTKQSVLDAIAEAGPSKN